MSQPVIKVENLSKIYRIGEIGTGSIGQDVDRWFKTKILGKEDPFLKIGEQNDRATKGKSDLVYSLKDINFEVNQGDAVGIIGRNGAGKSTLLKILSRITSPTSGRVNIKGRVASLLEVGTGFHPELTGRENIYLNGTILGMRKHEIDRKLDEIIDFSGIERYIDTPVKRYSSGMYVRLAFAVAAHLESEILIVDEVLAVGDAEFQKKCLGKMGEVSKGEGRTVLFVSHNLNSVRSLCEAGIYMKNGFIVCNGNIQEVLSEYHYDIDKLKFEENEMKSEYLKIESIQFLAENNRITNIFQSKDTIHFRLIVKVLKEYLKGAISIQIEDFEGQNIVFCYDENSLFKFESGENNNLVDIQIDNLNLAPGYYKLNLWIGLPNIETYIDVRKVLTFKIEQGSKIPLLSNWKKEYGLTYIEPKIKIF
jgi:lipopolysaccharide transport system ATP-binding protein